LSRVFADQQHALDRAVEKRIAFVRAQASRARKVFVAGEDRHPPIRRRALQGIAEFAIQTIVRCEALVKRTFDLFPDAGDRDSPQFWTGLRPATPSNVPLLGRTRLRNLFLDTGHGTLGWTMACGSGRALADIIAGRRPGVDFAFTGSG